MNLLDKDYINCLKYDQKTKEPWQRVKGNQVNVASTNRISIKRNFKKESNRRTTPKRYNNWNEKKSLESFNSTFEQTEENQQTWKQVNWNYTVWGAQGNKYEEKWRDSETCGTPSIVPTYW